MKGAQRTKTLLILGGATLFYLVLLLRNAPLANREPLLMIPVATMGATWGLLPAAFLSAGYLLLELFTERSGLSFLWLAAVLATSAWISNLIGNALRAAHRRLRRTNEELRLLVAALEELSNSKSREGLLGRLPKLIKRHSDGHISLWEPQGDRLRIIAAAGLDMAEIPQIPMSGIVGRAHRQGVPLYIDEVSNDPTYIAGSTTGFRSELVLPLIEQGEIVALLNFEYKQSIHPRKQESLQRFSRTVSQLLTNLSEQREARLASSLSEKLARADSLQAAAEDTLTLLVPSLNASGGTLLTYRSSYFTPVALFGAFDDPDRLHRGLPIDQGAIEELYRQGKSYREVTVPANARGEVISTIYHQVGSQRPVRTVLLLEARGPRLWTRAERELIASASRTLELALTSIQTKEQLDTLLKLERESVNTSLEDLYHKVLEASLRTVPGAEVGSLLLRDRDTFHYQAAVGYDLESLQRVVFEERDMAAWCGGGEESWRSAEPRILSRDRVVFESLNENSAARRAIESAGRLDDIEANLYLPIIHQGEVLAVLNLDNLHDPISFGQDSLEAARLFAPPVAALLQDTRYRDLLEQAARSDPLTGLMNRRAFDEALSQELSRAGRHGECFTLMIMDLTGFKQINDQLGHHRGDEALIQVTGSLRSVQRRGDALARWGGDEFAVLLRTTTCDGASAAAQRFAQAIGGIQLEGLSLGVNIGMAVFPTDGDNANILLKVADERMYAAKRQGVTLLDCP